MASAMNPWRFFTGYFQTGDPETGTFRLPGLPRFVWYSLAVLLIVGAGVVVYFTWIRADNATPEGAVGAFVQGLADENYAKVCEVTGPVMELTLSVQSSESLDAPCETSAEANSLPSSVVEEAENADVMDVDIDGDSATVDTDQGQWGLSEVDGGWVIQEAPFIELPR